MPTATSTATSFTLTEEGGGTLTLTGRALPYLPLSITGKQRAEFTWYPGSPSATVQMLGPEEGAITIRGFWKDKFLLGSNDAFYSTSGDQSDRLAVNAALGTRYESAAALVQQVDTMRRMGRRIRLAWDTIIRYGHITSFTQTWFTPSYCEWEMEFSVAAQESGEITAITLDEVDLPSVAAETNQQANAVDLALGNVVAASSGFSGPAVQPPRVTTPAAPLLPGAALVVPPPPGTPVPPNLLQGALNYLQGIQDQILGVAQAIDGYAQQAVGVVNQVNQIVSWPGSTVRSFMSTLSGSVTSLSTSVGAIANTAISEWYAVAEVFGGQDAVPLGYQMGASSYKRIWMDAARSVIYSNAVTASIAQQQLQQDLVSQYYASRNMDMRDISQQAYGTPNYWQQLMIYNGRTDSYVRAGTMLFVPNDPSYFGAGLPAGGTS